MQRVLTAVDIKEFFALLEAKAVNRPLVLEFLQVAQAEMLAALLPTSVPPVVPYKD